MHEKFFLHFSFYFVQLISIRSTVRNKIAKLKTSFSHSVDKSGIHYRAMFDKIPVSIGCGWQLL
jgi:hypothetical protein